MTMPNERAKALLWARALLKDLTRCEEVPDRLRKEARFILRHYPLASQVRYGARLAPDFLEVDPTDPIVARALNEAGDSDIY
jgi:hypothetical protein